MEINAIAMGKKPLSFLDYEAVITPGNRINTLSSVNVVYQGKILAKIRTDIPLNQTNSLNLEKLIKQTITNFLTGKETGADSSASNNKKSAFKTSKKQAKAKTEAANELFTMFNL